MSGAEPRPGSREFNADPWELYRRLRAEAPVAPVTLSSGRKAWIVTRYDDALSVLRDPLFTKERNKARGVDSRPSLLAPKILRALERNMLDVDDPDHRRLRALVQKAFTPRLIESMSDSVARIARELLDALPQDRPFDLLEHFARPLPVRVIAEMLGIAPSERHHFERWSARIVAADSSDWAKLRALPSIYAFVRYIGRLIDARRANAGTDFISALVAAEEEGEKLDREELVAMIFILLVAGHETTVNLIGNGMLALLTHPAELARLRNDRALLGSAIEEMLRYASPLQMATERYACPGAAAGGVSIPRGDLVYVSLAAANRDERQFEDPDRFDISRSPNPHLAFGLGIHHCLGAPLARLEGAIAIDALVSRFGEIRLTERPGKLRWRKGVVLRGLERLRLIVRQ
jgi:cytochrome P450